MKMFLLALSLVATLNQPILLLNSGSDYNPTSFWDLGYDLNYIIDHFYTGVDKGLEIIDDFSDIVLNLGIEDSPNIQATPSVKYYNQPNTYTQNNTSYYDYKSYTNNYDNRSYATTYNYDNRTYTYNPIYNDYRTYDYTSYNNYNYFEDNDYYYITNNNITNYEYYIVNKIDVNDNRYYSYYYELPSGSKSYNLTKEQVLGEFMSYNCYQYESVPDDDSLLGLWHFDGNYNNETSSAYTIQYDSSSFVNAHFGGGIKLDGTNDMKLVGDMPSQYTIEFWFYNNINNGTFNAYSPNAWHHMVRTYDNGYVRGWVDGNEVSIAKHESLSTTYSISTVNSSIYTANITKDSGFKYTQNGVSYPWYYRYIISTSPASIIRGFTPTINNDYFKSTIPSSPIGNNSTSVIIDRGHTIQSYSSGSHTNSLESNVYYTNKYYTPRVYVAPISATPYSDVDPADPLHYYPLCSDNGVLFGFTGSSHTVTNVNVSVPLYCILESDTNHEYKINAVPSTTTTTNNNYCNMSECIIDEMRLTEGLLYTDNFSVPQDPFEFGHIWQRPSGDDFNIGDIAIQSDISITDYRIGGADYSYPTTGNVYIGLNSNVGLYAKVYNGQNWVPCDFGVWNGTGWADGVGFNFVTLTWGTKNNDINIDINISTDVNVTETDKKGFMDIVGFIFELFAFIPLCIGFLTIIPTPINIILIGLMGLLAVLIVLKIVKR